MAPFHPDIALAARLLPRSSFGPRTSAIVRKLTRFDKPPQGVPGIAASLQPIPGAQSARVFVPEGVAEPMPVMLWIHGGGFIIGSPAQDDAMVMDFAQRLNMVVVAPSYRLGPDHPHPAAIDDLHATLKWIHTNPTGLPIDRSRIVIAGASAGGGLAAGLTLLARDRKEIPVAFQLLIYPMLDDRTVNKEIDGTNHRMWTVSSNRYGWTSYLGRVPGGEGVSPYAAPARVESVAGLPPTWIGVGTCDLFHDEDVAYAGRLKEAGVPVDLEIVPGVFHGFDSFRGANVTKQFFARQVEALRRALARHP